MRASMLGRERASKRERERFGTREKKSDGHKERERLLVGGRKHAHPWDILQ
jgi:hypothetical protein